MAVVVLCHEEGRRQEMFVFVFFPAEDGIRVRLVTGVQTCALPISWRREPRRDEMNNDISITIPTLTWMPWKPVRVKKDRKSVV